MTLSVTFVSTVLATLPVRSASQGESFAFIGSYNVLNTKPFRVKIEKALLF
jgi:hypothetical protein